MFQMLLYIVIKTMYDGIFCRMVRKGGLAQPVFTARSLHVKWNVCLENK